MARPLGSRRRHKLGTFVLQGAIVAAFGMVVGAALAAQDAHAACQFSGESFNIASTTITNSIVLAKNETCSHTFRSRGSFNVFNLTLTQRPGHGMAGVNN